MRTIAQQFQIDYSYPVFFTRNVFAKENPAFADFLNPFARRETHKKVLFVVDDGLLSHHPTLPAAIADYFRTHIPTIGLAGEPLVVPGGEAAKNDPALFDRIVDAVDQRGIDRHSFVVAVGGGAVLDLVGYAAAVAHRGVRHIRVPTTVLSQNDSGVGVKNGVNYRGKKNFLGTFAPPVAVFNDSAFLTTLDDRDWRGGVSEAVKVALIKDAEFFGWIEDHTEALRSRDLSTMETLIYRCAEMHTEHIRSGDPFEFGSSRPLDFGHWAAHKLENLTDFTLRHGEAVAIGIVLDSIYSQKKGLLTNEELHRIIAVFQNLGFELFHPKLSVERDSALLKGLDEFREHLGGRLTIMLLEGIGKGVEVHEMDKKLVGEAADFLRDFALSGKDLNKA